MKKPLTTICLCLLSACATQPHHSIHTGIDQWIGKDNQALLKEWGPPTRTRTLPNGRVAYEYSSTTTRPFPYPTTPRGVIVVGPNGRSIGYAIQGDNPQQYVTHCLIVFELSTDNKVKSAQQQGKGC